MQVIHGFMVGNVYSDLRKTQGQVSQGLYMAWGGNASYGTLGANQGLHFSMQDQWPIC